MNKRFLNVFLCGVVILSTGAFYSCDDDVDDLKSRVSVLEVAIEDLKNQLSKALTTGASIIQVEEDAGTYKLTLSDGQIITIKPGTSGGSSITVEKNENNVIITVDGTEYVLPMGSALNSLVYSPEYADGIVNIGNAGATVNFLATPAVSSDELKNATFDFAEAHELKTRSSNGLFKIDGEVTLDGDFIKVPVKAIGTEAGKTYAAALLMNLNGTIISSNYFTVKVSDDFYFNSEELVTPAFVGISDAAELPDGFWTATLPETDAVSFLNEFNFNTLLSLPSINAADMRFELGPRASQNGNVQDRYDFFRSCLSENGTWKMQGRPGTNCNKKEEDEKPDGLLVYVKVNDVVKTKVYWKIVDPLADINFVGGLAGLCSQHMEHSAVFPKGVNKYDMAKEITAGNFDPKHGDADKFIAAFQAYNIMAGSETVVMNNGEKLEVTEYGKKFTKFSRGLNWFNIQTSVIASSGNGGNAEIVNGWDGISGDDMANLGLKITNDGYFETTSAYGGTGLRVGMGLEFEYDYGLKNISEGCLAYIFFNRRVSPEGVTNIEPR